MPFENKSFNRQRYLSFRNDSGAAIPPFGIVHIVGLTTISDKHLYLVEKPNETKPIASHIFNGPTSIPNLVPGTGHQDFPARVLGETSHTFSVGELCGPKNNQFTVSTSKQCFQVIGIDPFFNALQVLIVQNVTGGGFVGKVTSEISARSGTSSFGSGEVEIYYKNPSHAPISNGQTITIYNMVESTVAVDRFIQFKIDGYGTAWVDTDSC